MLRITDRGSVIEPDARPVGQDQVVLTSRVVRYDNPLLLTHQMRRYGKGQHQGDACGHRDSDPTQQHEPAATPGFRCSVPTPAARRQTAFGNDPRPAGIDLLLGKPLPEPVAVIEVLHAEQGLGMLGRLPHPLKQLMHSVVRAVAFDKSYDPFIDSVFGFHSSISVHSLYIKQPKSKNYLRPHAKKERPDITTTKTGCETKKSPDIWIFSTHLPIFTMILIPLTGFLLLK